MSYYWDQRFLRHINEDVKTVIEVGSRYGEESIELSKHFPLAHVYSFECNPNTIDTCRKNLANKEKISFFAHGLGETNEYKEFYPYVHNNDGASSFYKRYDFNNTQVIRHNIEIKKTSDVLNELTIETVDLLCMDIQGYELNVLKGCPDVYIRYIIMEEPKPDIVSRYIGAPSSKDIKDYMTRNNFIEIERIPENLIEDNVMYKRVS